MTPSRPSTAWITVLSLLCSTGVTPAWAALGGTHATIEADAASMRALRHDTAAHASYQVHELTLASGTVVREFIAPSGSVFAVAWQGPFKPDLSQVLGAYFPRAVAAGQERRVDHRRLTVHARDLVIESGGRMRAFAGRAYLPASMPANVTLGEIR